MANLNYYIRRFKALTLTEMLIGVNVIMFIISSLLGLTFGNALVLLGAKVNLLIGLGEIWRLLTAMFLHADFMHLVFNMLALYILGRDIERFYGPKKYLFIYFTSGLIGSAFSFLLIPHVSVGASGAIFGLFGANLYLYHLNPTVYKRLFGTDIMVLIVINLVISFVRPNIDFVGHIAGLVGGLIASFAVGIHSEKAFIPKRIAIQAVTIMLLILPTFIGISQLRSTPDFYANAAGYYYYQNRMDKAEGIIDKGIEKFPDNEQLLGLKSAFN